MKTTSILLVLAAAGITAYAYRRTRDRGPMVDTGDEPYTDSADTPFGLAGVAGGSPNAGERTQARQREAAGDEDIGRWFGSSSQEAETPASTGLPDLTRGT
jgi:hypothetical protein